MTDFNRKASGTDIIHLNVSGKLVAVLRSTLTCLEGSMLAARFSGRWDDSHEKDREDNFFINQPPDLFVPMIEFLQRIGNSIPAAEATRFLTVEDFGGSNDRFEDFADMVEHYGMTTLVLPPTIYFAGKANPEGRLISHHNLENGQECPRHVRISGHHVEARECSFFHLRTQSRDVRRIRSFEVTIGNIRAFRMGWGTEDADALIFDFRGSELFYKRHVDRIPTGLRVESGSVIRCELMMGSDLVWTVKGESFRRPQDSTPVWPVRNADFYLKINPTFAGTGIWWVSKIEF
jgi:BTB/POZ domain